MGNKKNFGFLVVNVFVCLALIMYYYLTTHRNLTLAYKIFDRHNSKTSIYTILIMYPENGRGPVGKLPEKCGNCEVSVNVEKDILLHEELVVTIVIQIEDKNTKALVFHFNDPIFDIAPKSRRLDQHYVWYTEEGPVAIYHLRNLTLREYDGFFNLTMSYRRDSDVWTPFGSNYWLLQERKDLPLDNTSLEDFVKRKKRTALWVVSNCNVMPHARERKSFVMALIDNGLQVDLGGGCFDNIKDDFENHKYKFYLAFENQWNCKDYITEKFWDNALKHGTVPVVLGPPKKDYELVAPSPNSFIYAADFDSPKDLADYLNYLDKNDNAYKEYLSWMKSVLPVKKNMKRTGFCLLCSLLHNYDLNHSTMKPRVVPSLYDWFYGQDYQECLGVPHLGMKI